MDTNKESTSENTSIEKLENSLMGMLDGKEKVDALLSLCDSVKEKEPKKLNFYAGQALDISQKINYKLGIAKSHKFIGQSHSHNADFKTAIDHLDSALLLSRSLGDKKLEANALLHLGIVYKNFDYSKSIESYFESLEISRSLNDHKTESHLLNNIGVVFKILGNFKVALEYYLDSLKIKESLGNEETIHNTLSNIGNIYVIMENYEKGLEYASKSLELLRKFDKRTNEPVILGNIALCNKKLGNTDVALKYYNEALDIAKKMGNRQSEADNFDGLGEMYLAKGDYDKAIECFGNGLQIAEDIKDRVLISNICHNIGKLMLRTQKYDQCISILEKGLEHSKLIEDKSSIASFYPTFSAYYEAVGNYMKAIEYLKLYNELNKELLKSQTEMVTRSLMIQHEAERHQKEAEMNRVKNEELTRIVKKLDEINEDKNNFIGIVSHDLRDPVSSIYSISDLILADYSSLSEEDKRDFVTDIKTSAGRVIKLLQTLLDINAIETGRLKMDFENNNLTEITKKALEFYTEKAKAKNIDLHFTEEKPVLFYGDRRSVEQILSNLISNSIKYTEPGKNVYISISESENVARFEIDDEGPGMTEDDKKSLFGRFAKLSARPTAGEESFGLGLSIVKKLVDINKGKVWCESELGKGAKFFVELPKARI